MHLIKTTAVLASSFGLISASYNYPSADANELYAREAYDLDGPELYERDAFDYEDHALRARDAEAEAYAEAEEYGFADDSRLFARSPTGPSGGPSGGLGGSPGASPMGCSAGCHARFTRNEGRIARLALRQKMQGGGMGGSPGSSMSGGAGGAGGAGGSLSKQSSMSGSSGSSKSALMRRAVPGAEIAAMRSESGGASSAAAHNKGATGAGARPRPPFNEARLRTRNKQSLERCNARCHAGAPGVGGGRGGSQEHVTRAKFNGGLPGHGGMGLDGKMSGGGSSGMGGSGGSGMGSGAGGAGGSLSKQGSMGGGSGGMGRSDSQLSMSSTGSGKGE